MDEVKKYCYLCASLPTDECRKDHPECVEEDIDAFAERWARDFLGDEEYERRMRESEQ